MDGDRAAADPPVVVVSPAQLPPDPPHRPINSGHVANGAGITAMLAGLLVWVTHRPLQPFDLTTAMDAAGLIVAGGMGILAFIKYLRTPRIPTPPVQAKTI